MIVTYGAELKDGEFGATAAALGSFDALHIGHTRIIGAAVSHAKKNGIRSLAQLFSYPEEMRVECVNTIEKRIELLDKMGVDIVVVERFDENFKNMTAAEFIKSRIIDEYGAKAVFAGFNYRFGKDAAGDTELLKRECTAHGVGVYIADCVMISGGCVSSSRIRAAIKNGDVAAAAEMMNRPYSLCGAVLHGKQIGRTIGFPTVNMDLPKNLALPAAGVYETGVRIGGTKYSAITNVGAKPTVHDSSANIETHIIGFEGNLYGKKIEVEFYEKLREIQSFGSIDGLRAQLESDIKRVNQKRKGNEK